MTGPESVLSFWLDEVGPGGWYGGSDALDATIRERFETLWEGACEGRYSLWLTYPSGALAYIILMDQLSRNMFRGTSKAFLSDRAALTAAKSAIDKGWDLKIDAPARVFFYMPLEHSENLYDQDRCIRLMHERLPEGGGDYKLHAQAHRSVIRQFGRFPSRNEALGRPSTPAESAFMANGGYGDIVQRLRRETVAA
jgi:uncharacterized protein (DUF924 family)